MELSNTSVPVVVWWAGAVGPIPGSFHTQVDWLSGVRVTIERRSEVWNRIHSETDAHHYESTTYPHGPTKSQTEVTDDQEGRNSRDLVQPWYPSCLATGKRKSSLDRWHVHSEKSVHYHRLQKPSNAHKDEKPARTSKELETVGSTTQTSIPGLEPAAADVRFSVLWWCADVIVRSGRQLRLSNVWMTVSRLRHCVVRGLLSTFTFNEQHTGCRGGVAIYDNWDTWCLDSVLSWSSAIMFFYTNGQRCHKHSACKYKYKY